MYETVLRELISQGDVFTGFSLSDYVFEDADTPAFGARRVGPVVLISNDCDYDNKKFVMVAELLVLRKAVSSEQMDIVRSYQTRRLFYYSSYGDRHPESCVDFCKIHRIDKRFISDCKDTHPRVASLTDQAQSALRMRLAFFFGVPDPIDR